MEIMECISTPVAITKRIPIQYNKPGSVLKVHIKQSLCEELKRAQEALQEASGCSFSSSILVRRALHEYLQDVLAMGPEEVSVEVSHLLFHYR